MIKRLKHACIAIFTHILIMQMSAAAIYADTSEIIARVIATGLDYDQVYEYSDGLARVEKDGKYGFIDTKGNLVIPLIYTHQPGSFSEGLAAVVEYPSGLSGYIDKTGKLVVPYGEYSNASAFSDGMALVEKDGKYGFINKTGQIVIPIEYDDVQPFSEGFAAVRKDSDRKWGYIDKTGKVVIPFKYDRASVFVDGLACVSDWGGQYKDHYGYIDTFGSIVVPLQYDTAFDFSEGLAGVRKNDKTGYIDQTGKVVIPIEYDSHDRRFSDGLANVFKGGKWGYIDKNGKVAIPFRYASAEAFSDGMAAVSMDGAKFGYIDKTGQLVIPYQYGNNYDMAFRDGLAHVTLYDMGGFQKQMETKPSNEWTYQYGFIDKKGRFVVPFAEYMSNLGPIYSDGMMCLPNDGKWTIMSVTTQIKKDITATFGATRYTLNGEPFEQETLLYNDAAYLPAAYLAAKLGLYVSWDAASNTTTLTSTETKPLVVGSETLTAPASNPITKNITVTFGATQYILNGEPFDEQTLLYNDTAYLPAAYLARKLGLTANWDAAANITALTSR